MTNFTGSGIAIEDAKPVSNRDSVFDVLTLFIEYGMINGMWGEWDRFVMYIRSQNRHAGVRLATARNGDRVFVTRGRVQGFADPDGNQCLRILAFEAAVEKKDYLKTAEPIGYSLPVERQSANLPALPDQAEFRGPLVPEEDEEDEADEAAAPKGE